MTQSTPKKSRKQWNSPLARQKFSNERRKMARAAADREKAALDRARTELSRAKSRLENVEKNKRSNMVANGMTPRLRAVMSSYGLNLNTDIKASHDVSAWTDFSTITVNYDQRLNYTGGWNDPDKELRVVTTEDLRQIAAETRGLFYHELGHNLFTVPLAELLTLAWEDGYTPVGARLRNSPTPVTYRDRSTIVTYPEWAFDGNFQRAWNIMEDQRMECLLVEDSPQLASYLTVLVLRLIIGSNKDSSSWALVAGRKYLPRSVRMAAKAQWADVSDVDADTVATLISSYAKATDAVTMVQVIETFANIILNTPTANLDDHNFTAVGNKEQPKRPDLLDAPDKLNDDEGDEGDEGDDEGEEISMPGGEASDEENEDGEGDDESTSKSGDEDDDTSKSGGDDDTSKGDDDHDDESVSSSKDTRDEAKKAFDEAKENLADDKTLDDDVTAMNEAYNVDDGALPSYGDQGEVADPELVSTAAAMVDEMVRAFEIATADCAPHWESGQRRGVLEPIRYRTRQPGDLEIFRSFADEGEPGNNIAVSVFLDVSGSMQGSTDALGAAAWATKRACEQINVDCDVTLFDSNAWSLWSVDESPTYVPSLDDHYTTDPRAAFDAILTDERDKEHHLVLVMTDGAWDSDAQDALRDHRFPNMKTMLFLYSPHNRPGMRPDPGKALQLSADEAYQIRDLMDIPRALESMLVDLV